MPHLSCLILTSLTGSADEKDIFSTGRHRLRPSYYRDLHFTPRDASNGNTRRSLPIGEPCSIQRCSGDFSRSCDRAICIEVVQDITGPQVRINMYIIMQRSACCMHHACCVHCVFFAGWNHNSLYDGSGGPNGSLRLG